VLPSAPIEHAAAAPVADPPSPAERRRGPGRAWTEIVLCSGYPTQVLLGQALSGLGISPVAADGSLSARFVFALSLSDTAVLVSLMLWLLRRSGEQPRAVFFGPIRVGEEAVVGLLSLPFIVAMVMALALLIRTFAPFLHNIPENPLEGLLRTQTSLWAFLAVVIVAGGLREELQRAFLLHRFRHDLGHAGVGLVVTSVAFGLGHTLQGWDAAILTGALGAVWGLLYLTRRSAIGPIVSHSLFNTGELLRAFWR